MFVVTGGVLTMSGGLVGRVGYFGDRWVRVFSLWSYDGGRGVGNVCQCMVRTVKVRVTWRIGTQKLIVLERDSILL